MVMELYFQRSKVIAADISNKKSSLLGKLSDFLIFQSDFWFVHGLSSKMSGSYFRTVKAYLVVK
jgi:hypothetical protein